MSIRESATLRVFCYVDVAVSIGEAAKPRVFCYVLLRRCRSVYIGEAAKLRVFPEWVARVPVSLWGSGG